MRNIASEGSVSIVDLEDCLGNGTCHRLARVRLAVSPDQKYIVCANAGSDNLSLIEIAVRGYRHHLGESETFRPLGASPNGLVFAADGKSLYAANGTQNSIAVIHFEPEDKGESVLQGLIPVGWFPGARRYDKTRKSLYVANIKGFPWLQRGEERRKATTPITITARPL